VEILSHTNLDDEAHLENLVRTASKNVDMRCSYF